MKKILVAFLAIGMAGLLSGCQKSETALIGMVSKTLVEYIDQDHDGAADAAIVSMTLTLDEDSTTGYEQISVLWDGVEVAFGSTLPITDRQIVDLTTNAAHTYSIAGEWQQGSMRGSNSGIIRIKVSNGMVEPVEDIHLRSSLELSY